ncbi:hypothetical protein MW290_25450 [Aquincola tertiaricarbonis]|uniref:Uncharacterized protein n=1 Tax=Aquincola tertiaricarbonis TaxID=391953 RepID=A0ABY4S6F5_AQUTE|nr:hypothetical protein [Aquincola tertiaricarbonis]URI08917.1 hypothetical protein MW290_25450 [Aquincola tertiaricarbonis]
MTNDPSFITEAAEEKIKGALNAPRMYLLLQIFTVAPCMIVQGPAIRLGE